MTETTKPYDEQFLVGANLNALIEAVLKKPHYSPPDTKITFTVEFPRVGTTTIFFRRYDEETTSVLKTETRTDDESSRLLLTQEIEGKLWRYSGNQYLPPNPHHSLGFQADECSSIVREFLNTVCDWLPDVTEIKRTFKDQAPSDHDGLTVNWTVPTGTASTFFPYESILNDVGNKYLMERMIAYTRLGWTKYSHPSENGDSHTIRTGSFGTNPVVEGTMTVEKSSYNGPIQVHPVFGSNLPYLDTMPKYTNQPMSPVAPNAPTIINQVSLEEVIEKALGAKITAMTTAPDSNAPTINVNPSQGLSEEEIAKAVKKFLAHEHPEVLAGASKDSIQELWDAVETLREDVERAGTLNPNIVNNIYSDKYKVQS